MDLATDGCDASAASLQIARGKHPTKRFCNADVAALPFADASFDAIFCFHVFMHLPMSEIEAACEECARVLRPGGSFIVDVASRFRRRLRVPRPADWHGGTALDSSRLAALAHRSGLRRKAIEGVMLLPAHRLPEGLRGPLCSIDRRLAALAPDLASYIVGVFVKEPRR
jgi:SAM-dependent methyltransferase